MKTRIGDVRTVGSERRRFPFGVTVAASIAGLGLVVLVGWVAWNQGALVGLRFVEFDSPLSLAALGFVAGIGGFFAPCAFGGVLNPVTIPQLQCRIVAGAANNQLADEDRDGELLRQRGILYAVDYVINSGGLMHVSQDIQARGTWSAADEESVKTRASRIYDTVTRMLELARAEGISPHQAARRMALETIQAARLRARESQE